ncbi:amino acid permease [Shimwellia blattae]|uniref:Transporte protein YqeG n=1 Tax=Shimwellia blattae (strain ATCC 29907 / DSM 4481 / JCM 1650 / NBRC 105725 / CDC 9005-74) TaxID=630626 RepID=I2BC64_SHIBC|nr:amino acid permease [Shimwellia blattae]AFJ48118.1 transporte protein YqeG [Shimwellia blattae DSM 4481 = NBRC 105725]GAB81895.1 putative HAAAP family transporter YqeG [Shimwellia blattae DSM 4481 = NBRC 105725]VDY65617.1 Inner membrane transport protein YqeG [Shimwellia blattae]VEC25110.1 Inner membrane transport protein YqeG [Shimwellia blattae]
MSKIWSKEETLWSFALYGTAVGAGTLFLPIQLGSAGAVVLFITALVAWPLTYWPHRALCQFILSSNTASTGEGITAAVTHYYGKRIGSLITALYFIAFFVVVLIYAVAITNSLVEQLAKHMAITTGVRMLVSLAVVVVLNLIFLMGRHVTIRVMGFLVFPLIAYFLFLSLYLTGSWQPSLLTGQMTFDSHTLHQVWISIPVMVFAFSHTPIISTFAIDRREKYAEKAMDKCKKIMKVAYLIICLSVLFFVFSCVLSIPPSYITAAKDHGVTILSALSMMPNAPAWLSVSGIIVAVVAMSKSFLGTYFGVIEGATEMVRTGLQQVGVKKSRAFNRALSIMLVSLLTFVVCCINPNAISMIYAISGPLIAMILFIMPTLSTYLLPALKPYRSLGNLITLIVGLLCVSVMFLG